MRGYIVPIGGGEEREANAPILKRFVQLCGGREARLVVIPTASRREETGRNYERLFREMGVPSIAVLRLETRQECEQEAALSAIEGATGVFLTGGSQLRLSTTLGGTSVARLLRQRNADGAHIAGTSAGASFLSEHMIAYGDEGATPRADMVTLAPGLGLTNRFIIDQHFRQRDRIGRLLSALSFNPFAIGLGLDEDTAAFFGPDDRMEVVGTGGITVLDASKLEHSSMDEADRGKPVSLIGVRLHILVHGGTFDADAREARAASP